MNFRPLCIASALALTSLPLSALELGFEGRLSVTASDNVNVSNDDEAEEGSFANATLTLFGDQRGQVVQAGFEGDIDTREQFGDEGSSGTLTRFLGAVNVNLTPRAWSWYAGNILGGVRTDDAVQTLDELDVARRNVFMTGPAFRYEIDAFSRTESRLLFVHQTEEGDEIESLYNASFGFERDLSAGQQIGLRVTDVFTDRPDDNESSSAQAGAADFNRLSASVLWQRSRQVTDLSVELGATRYDTDDDEQTGLNARLSGTRRLGPLQSATLTLSQDLRDETLNTVESLISGGEGLRPEADGIFDETRLEALYQINGRDTILDTSVGIVLSDYRATGADDSGLFAGDSEDQTQHFARASLSRALTSRLRLEGSVNAEQQRYDNRSDEVTSLLFSSALLYQVARSFEFELGYAFDRSDGTRTRVLDEQLTEEDIDRTENRVTLGVRWVPPTRASRELTVELKSLLQ